MKELCMPDYYVYVFIVFIGLLILYILRLKMSLHTKKHREEELILDAYFHPVTHLPNKKNISYVFDEQIGRTLRHNRSFFIFAVKIQNYVKLKNNSPELAEQFIREASDILISSTRDEDLIAHIDDDTFIILFNEYLEGDNYKIVLQRLKNGFEDKIHSKLEIAFEPSIGMSIYPEDGTDGDILIEKAVLQAKSKQF